MNLLKRTFNLKMNAGAAKFELATIGPVLSPYTTREAIKSFCEAFNVETAVFKQNLDILVTLYLNHDHTFFFAIKGPRLVNLIRYYHLTFDCEEKFIPIRDLFNVFLVKHYFLLQKLVMKNDFYLKTLFKSTCIDLHYIKKI